MDESWIVDVAARLLLEQGPAAVTTRGVAVGAGVQPPTIYRLGTVLTMLSTPPEQRDPGLAEEMLDAVLRQILTDAPERAESEATTSAVALRGIAPGLDMLSDGERHLLTEWLDRVIVALEM